MLQTIPPILDRPIRIALVGCGRVSANHIKAIAAHRQRAELTAICDPNPEQLAWAAQRIHATSEQDQDPTAVVNPRQFRHYGDLLHAVRTEQLAVDLVVLSTPSGLHPRQTIAAAQAGS